VDAYGQAYRSGSFCITARAICRVLGGLQLHKQPPVFFLDSRKLLLADVDVLDELLNIMALLGIVLPARHAAAGLSRMQGSKGGVRGLCAPHRSTFSSLLLLAGVPGVGGTLLLDLLLGSCGRDSMVR
jgi:hypothetical protein